jgi:hypothetical protein
MKKWNLSVSDLGSRGVDALRIIFSGGSEEPFQQTRIAIC